VGWQFWKYFQWSGKLEVWGDLMNPEIWKRLFLLSLAFVLLFAGVGRAAPADVSGAIGSIQKASGTAVVIRQGQTIPVQPGLKIWMNDTLRTGGDGSIGVVFQDETLLSLGPESVLSIEEYIFAPKQGKFSIVLKMFKGTAVYLSGLISKLSPDSARFETPSASVGIRGTKFAVKVEGR
jgi:hypothetical protein